MFNSVRINHFFISSFSGEVEAVFRDNDRIMDTSLLKTGATVVLSNIPVDCHDLGLLSSHAGMLYISPKNIVVICNEDGLDHVQFFTPAINAAESLFYREKSILCHVNV